MAKKFSALVASTMSPESILRAKKATQAMLEKMPLNFSHTKMNRHSRERANP